MDASVILNLCMYSVLEDRTDSFWRVRRGERRGEGQEGEENGERRRRKISLMEAREDGCLGHACTPR
jgi:hypothetical protein